MFEQVRRVVVAVAENENHAAVQEVGAVVIVVAENEGCSRVDYTWGAENCTFVLLLGKKQILLEDSSALVNTDVES